MKPLEHFLWIGNVEILKGFGGKYVCFISNLDICNDGSGPSHDDPSYQSQTAYAGGSKTGTKYLNADVDQYIVVPPQIRSGVPPVVMGCQARITNLMTGQWFPAVVGDIGPQTKTGEAAYCVAKKTNPKVGYNTGDSSIIYLYELWPGIPAVVDGFTYKLQPAG
jgi:Fungal chitosanase of glycosyl hydrolase group 75